MKRNKQRGCKSTLVQKIIFGFTGCSTIISPFRNKDKEIIGAIGVIGPMRINYAKIIPVVDYTAKLIGKKFQITN